VSKAELDGMAMDMLPASGRSLVETFEESYGRILGLVGKILTLAAEEVEGLPSSEIFLAIETRARCASGAFGGGTDMDLVTPRPPWHPIEEDLMLILAILKTMLDRAEIDCGPYLHLQRRSLERLISAFVAEAATPLRS
jgi:hypothetical protein